MAIYSDLSKLGRVKLPSGTSYALVDVDGRAIIAPDFSAESSYVIGDHVIYGDNLYRFKNDKSAGDWNASYVDLVTIDSEIKRLEDIMAGGIHYRGKTTTALYDGATTNPISINGASYTASSGDLVIVDLANVELTYAINTAYNAHTYIKNGGIHYITNAAITAEENTSFSAVETKMDVLKTDPEYLFDGSKWALLGSISEGLGDLAFKDTASGSYLKPTGLGSVEVNDTTSSSSKLVQSYIFGVQSSTESVTKVTGGTEKDIAKVGSSVVYGTANVASQGTSVASVGEEVVYGTADVGATVSVGTSLTGTTTFNTDAIKAASLTGTTVFNTDAIKAASLTGTTAFNIDGVKVAVSGNELQFSAAATASVGIQTTPAGTGEVGINTTPASTASVGLGKTNITPAAAAPATQKLNKVSNVTIYEAVAAPNTQTLTPAVSNGKLTGSYTLTHHDVALKNTASTKFATGALASDGSGDTVVVTVGASASTKTVTVNTTTDTVVVR